MSRKLYCSFLFLYATAFVAKGLNSDVTTEFRRLSVQELLDTADYYFSKNSFDTALIGYALFVETAIKSTDIEVQKKMSYAFNRSAIIYARRNDYFSAYRFFIRALRLAENFNDKQQQAKVLLNIGTIYTRFYRDNMAKLYFSRALDLSSDSINITLLLNNLAAIELRNGRLDAGFYTLNNAKGISKRHNNVFLYNILTNISFYHKEKQNYDLAFYYIKHAVNEARKHNRIERKADFSQRLGELFFRTGQVDSAFFYIDMSRAIASEHRFLRILANNYLIRSKINEYKGSERVAFSYFKKYVAIRDSLLSPGVFGDIQELRHAHSILQMNQEIDKFIVNQQNIQRQFIFTKTILFIVFGMLLLVSVMLSIVFFQKRQLSTAHKVLVEKNLEIVDFQKHSSDFFSEKYKKSALTHDKEHELLCKILTIMEDTSIICDTEFSVDKLAEQVHSNQKYVSQAINNTLKKNFRSFLNGYRIKEAQKLFSEPDASKYSIDFMAFKVGFKSRNAFNDAFKEITGVTPTFYLKSMNKA